MKNRISYLSNCLVSTFLGFTLLFAACKPKEKLTVNIDQKSIVEKRYAALINYSIDANSFPRSMTLQPTKIRKVPAKDWTSGFFAGNLWHLYSLTNKTAYKTNAIAWTNFIENQKYNGTTHDMGFKIYCSFGEGYKITKDKRYRAIILTSAKTLSSRFNKKIGAIRSWDFNKEVWQFPVIIDNMMNLELLFEATRVSGDSTYHHIAEQHAITTLKNHFRANNSCYHVVDYDTISGTVKDKTTHQGLHKESTWARGQSWGIYGFTMAYRYTKNLAFLKQAEATAQFFINHPSLPDDKIPYWDFDDPAIPNAPRDVSAAAIIASALYELYGYTQNKTYLDFADTVLQNLSSKKYVLNEKIEAPFILNHSTGNWPKKDEMDVPLVYADYYFLEALIRKKAL